MYTGKLIFSMEHLTLHIFHQCVDRYHGNFKVKNFSCLDQYLCMAFAQLTYRESLRDIEVCLRAQKNKLYHIGIRSAVSRNNLANANKVRDLRICCLSTLLTPYNQLKLTPFKMVFLVCFLACNLCR